jgi:hypothetical protein
VDADGVSKVYTAKITEDTTQRHFARCLPQPSNPPEYFQESRCGEAVLSLKACIEGEDGHNGTILVGGGFIPNSPGSNRGQWSRTISLEQATPGPDGNTAISNTFSSPSNYAGVEISVPSKFTGGGSPSSTILRGGMDKRVTFLRKYFEKEQPQVVSGFLQSATPIVNSPQSYTTSSVEYYFDILVDSEIEQRIACKAAQVFNKQSYYVDLDFDCEEIEQDFVYADIYGRVTDPEICQT